MKSDQSAKSKSHAHQKSTKDIKDSESTTSDKTSPHHASRYFIIGLLLTVFNYGVYTVLANFIVQDNNFLWLSTLISTLITTIVAYLAHSKITWKERNITRNAVYKFFIWNLAAAFITAPILTQVFSYITPLYDFAYNICQNLHLDFTYDFIQSTGAFVLTGIVNMILNYLFYDRFVFGSSKINFELLFRSQSSSPNSKEHNNQSSQHIEEEEEYL